MMFAILKTFLAVDQDQQQPFACYSVIFSYCEQSRTNPKIGMGSNQEVIEVVESRWNTNNMIGENDIKLELINTSGSLDAGDKSRLPFNPDAYEFVPTGTSDEEAKNEPSFVFNPTASEFVFSSSSSSQIDSGKLGGEENCTSPTYLDENGNNIWFGCNPKTEDVPLNPENEIPSGSSLVDGVEVYKPWNQNGFECQVAVFNPEASEFIPSYKDCISENDRGHHPIHRNNTLYIDTEQWPYSMAENDQQFLHSNYFEDQQGLVQPVYPETEQQHIYFEDPEHPMIHKTDQHLIYNTTYPNNDVHYNMDWCQNQQPSYFPDESNEINNWSMDNVNLDVWKGNSLNHCNAGTYHPFFHQTYSEYDTGFTKNEPNLTSTATEPSEGEYYYSDTVPNSQSQEPPPPFSHATATPENTPVTIAPLYALIGVQPYSQRSERHGKSAIRRMMPIPRQTVPVPIQYNLGNQSTGFRQPVASPVQPYGVVKPLRPVPVSQVRQGQHYQTRINKPPAFSAPVKVVIPNVPGDAETPNGFPSLIPCILPQNYPWASASTIDCVQSFQNWQ
ncbi:hypothetical protein Ocin01_08629 [Orchesella cincta]|uniref:Uncharacterized protein n=1 Tax=Orchesella cincta TaxID=48709 RepID=A0A1D2MYH6_ORCCI|nr:hypothetical protein Ocin01_08629 [Orchesella cincta]